CRAAPAHRRHLSTARPSLFERGPGAVRDRVAGQRRRPAGPPDVDRRASPAAAACAPARATQGRPDSLAHSGHPPTRPALADEDLSVDQTLADSGATAPFPSRGAAGGGSLRPPRRRARPLGPRGPQRSARRGPAAHGGRRRSRRAAHPTAALAARCSGRAAPGRVVRGAHRRRPRRSRLARGGDPRPVLVSRRTAHDRAGHVVDGRPLACAAAALRREALMGNVALNRKLLRQTLPYWTGIAGLFALALLASAVALLNPVPLKLVVDSVLGTRPLPAFFQQLVVGRAANPTTAILLLAIGLLIAVAVLGHLQDLASTLLRASAGERLTLDFRARLMQQVQRLSVSRHDSRETTDSLYRIQQDALALQYITTDGIVPAIIATTTLVTMIAVTARLDEQLALVALLVSPPLFFLSRIYRPR